MTSSVSSHIPSFWPYANVNGSTADDNKGSGPSNDNGYWATTNSASPVHENNNWNGGPESTEAFWDNHNEDGNYGENDYWDGGYNEDRDGPRYTKNQWDVDNDDGNCDGYDSWGCVPDEGHGGSASTGESSQDSSDDDDSDSTGTQDDTPTSSSSALNQDLEETITALKQAIINLPARIAGVDQYLDKSQETTANVAEGMGSELKSQLDEKNAELLRLQKEIDALRQQSQREILRCELEIIDLHTNSKEVQQQLTEYRVKNGTSLHQIANLRSKDAESQQEIKDLRAQNAESRREVHRLLRVIRDEAPETFCREVMQDSFLDNMFRDIVKREDTVKQEDTVDLNSTW